jgi:hypothetical protein
VTVVEQPQPIFQKKKLFFTMISDFFLFWALKIHFRAGRHENNKKRLFYFGLIIANPNSIVRI